MRPAAQVVRRASPSRPPPAALAHGAAAGFPRVPRDDARRKPDVAAGRPAEEVPRAVQRVRARRRAVAAASGPTAALDVDAEGRPSYRRLVRPPVVMVAPAAGVTSRTVPRVRC